MSEIKMSQEEFDRFTKERAETQGQAVALAFMRSHVLDFHPCTANSEILTAYIKDNGLDFTTENLETAFEHCKNQLAKPQFRAPEKEEPVIADPLADYPLPSNWPAEISFSTRRDIHDWSADFYRLHYHDLSPRGTGENGQRFRARVTAIQTLRPGEGR